jgi:hypothetical protein
MGLGQLITCFALPIDCIARSLYNPSMAFPSTSQLKRALEIKLKIESLEGELQALIGDHQGDYAGNGSGRRRRGMSAASRARIAAAQRARWAKLKGKGSAKSGKKTRRKMPAAAKAKLAAIARKRWRLAKAAGKTAL